MKLPLTLINSISIKKEAGKESSRGGTYGLGYVSASPHTYNPGLKTSVYPGSHVGIEGQELRSLGINQLPEADNPDTPTKNPAHLSESLWLPFCRKLLVRRQWVDSKKGTLSAELGLPTF